MTRLITPIKGRMGKTYLKIYSSTNALAGARDEQFEKYVIAFFIYSYSRNPQRSKKLGSRPI